MTEQEQIQEQREALLREASVISANPNATKQELKRVDALLAQAGALKTRSQMLARVNSVAREAGLPEVQISEPTEESASAEELRTVHYRTGEYRRRTAD